MRIGTGIGTGTVKVVRRRESESPYLCFSGWGSDLGPFTGQEIQHVSSWFLWSAFLIVSPAIECYQRNCFSVTKELAAENNKSPVLREQSIEMKVIFQLLALALVAKINAFMPRGYRCTKPLARAGVKVMRKLELNVATEPSTEVEPENFKFESNVSRVMDIIINSLYSNKDVFIRELVSHIAMYFM